MPRSFDGRVFAPAKINLALHVTGQRSDGYHRLESLVVFANTIADELSIEAADEDRLSVDGPFAGGVPTDRRNIVVQALEFARDEARRGAIDIPPLSIGLSKNLPHAAGIGGGSADAAALLRHLGGVLPELMERFQKGCGTLGADVPMCFSGRPSIAQGIGDELTPIDMPHLPGLILINPGRSVATPAIFRALSSRENPPLPSLPANAFASFDTLVEWLSETRNDLQETAVAIESSIGDALRVLNSTRPRFSRMSGSGATVFGLFDNREHALAAANDIVKRHPNWWVATD